jgi:rRNA maturation protein Rpf1
MINFLVFFLVLIIFNSLRSARNYTKFSKIYKDLRFYNFNKQGSMLIANERANNEFIIFSDWHYKLSEGHFLNFDVWVLVDLHELYWLIKINRYFNSKLF